MKWISVKDKLPENDDHVLAFWKGIGAIHVNWYSTLNDKWMLGYKDVTHWMNLPEFPKFLEDQECNTLTTEELTI